MNADPSIAPPDEPDPELGRALRHLREERGLSLNELADRAEVDPETLARVERGAVDPRWSTVQALARGLGLSAKGVADAVAERRDEIDDR